MKVSDYFTVRENGSDVEVWFGSELYATSEIDPEDMEGMREFIHWCEETFDESDFLTGIEVGCTPARYKVGRQ